VNPQCPFVPEDRNSSRPDFALGLARESDAFVSGVEAAVTRRRVLFVDDEPQILEGVKAILRKETYAVMTAGSGQEALRILARQPVDLVVSDERMPDMPGSELLAMVRRLCPETVRIILTGHASVEAMARAINEGEIYRFLTKPCHPEVLAGTIRDALLIKEFKLQGARLIAANRRNRAVMDGLEQHHPGIAPVERAEDGAAALASGGDQVPELIDRIKKEAEAASSARRQFAATIDEHDIGEKGA
jgi:response regulator RpfG family c-di-GMP phosphodiesterase